MVKIHKPWEIVRGLSPAGRDPWLHLAAAVLKQAAVEAKRGDPGAALWLQSDLAGVFFEALELDRRRILPMAGQWAANSRGKIIIRMIPEAKYGQSVNRPGAAG